MACLFGSSRRCSQPVRALLFYQMAARPAKGRPKDLPFGANAKAISLFPREETQIPRFARNDGREYEMAKTDPVE